MASLNLEQFGDLVELTLDKYVRNEYVNLITDKTDFIAAKQLIKKNRMSHQAGTQYKWKVRMGTAGSYRRISATTPDQAEITDDFVEASLPFKKIEVKYAFLQEMVDFQGGPEKIVDLVRAKEVGADHDFIEGMEGDFWNFPSASDSTTLRGIPYWCTKNATEGFNGGIPTGYSDVAGISPTTYPRHNNYTAQYTSVTLDDMILKARTMAEKTNFKPSTPGIPDLGEGGSKSYYTNLSVKQVFENVADARNDNLGPDVAKHDNMAMFRRAPIVYVPHLDDDSTNPFYQLDFNVLGICVKTGWWLKRTILKPYPGQRNMVAVFKDTWMNIVCHNRRALGVLATGVTYPS